MPTSSRRGASRGSLVCLVLEVAAIDGHIRLLELTCVPRRNLLCAGSTVCAQLKGEMGKCTTRCCYVRCGPGLGSRLELSIEPALDSGDTAEAD